MKTIICKNYEEMSARAAEIVADVMKADPACVLGLATGSTPVGMYKKLIDMNKAGEIDFSKVTTVNLDEYYPIAPDNDQSYRYFMNENLFNHVNIDKTKTYVPDGMAADPDEACAAYEALVKKVGPADIQVLGIGQNGHIGFNEPADALEVATHVTGLTESTIKANARFFASESDVPTKALTMGIGTILSAKKIIILANGAAKAEAVKKMLAGKLDTSCPASMLNLHADVTVICDEAAVI
ncbi:MAG: glucosamine-6-phosphate deaminase [Ruminococcaceae bacterium]|nr:glucosamine-6-phosphate deaminase [Oscillospiraceae bacterium]